MADITSTRTGAIDPNAIRQSMNQLLVRYGIVVVLIVLVIAMSILSPILRDGQQLDRKSVV